MAKNKLDDKANSNTTDDMVYDLSFHIIIIICISGKPAWCHKDKTIAQFLTFSFLIQPHPYCSCFQPDITITLSAFFVKKSTWKN